MDDVAVLVAQNLELDMPRLFQILLHIQTAVAKRLLALVAGNLEQGRQLMRVVRNAQATPSTPGGRLEQDRETDLGSHRLEFTDIRNRSGRTGQDRNLGLLHNPPGARFIPHEFDVAHPGTDEHQPGTLTGFGKIRIFRQEAIARMHGVGAKGQRRADNRRDIEIAAGRRGRSDTHALIGQTHVQGVLIDRRIHGNGRNIERATGPDDPNRNLAPVGNQDFSEHGHSISGRSGCEGSPLRA